MVWIIATIKQMSRKFIREFMWCKLKHAFVLRYSNNYFNDSISNVKPGYFPFFSVPANSVRWVLLQSSRLFNWIPTGIKNIKATSQTFAGSLQSCTIILFSIYMTLGSSVHLHFLPTETQQGMCANEGKRHLNYFSVCYYQLQRSFI